MAGAPQLYRLSLATFSEADQLWRAVEWHLNHQFRSADLCLLGIHPVLEAMRGSDELTGHQRAEQTALTQVAPLGLNAGGYNLVATTNRFFTAFKQGSHEHGRCRIAPELQQRLVERTQKGAVALIANALTPEQHASSTLQLLEYSQQAVQSHLFVWPTERKA